MKTLLWILSLSCAVAGVSRAESLPILSPPPVRGSIADQRDFDEILEQQASRTPADCARAVSEEDDSLGPIFGPPYGPLNPFEIALLKDAFDRFADKIEVVVQAEKKNWTRLRPYEEDARVQPCVHKETSFSYPSGHATNSEFFALILAHIYADRDAALFFSRADQLGADRVLGGMHHPTDILAGQQLARALYAEWLQDPAFDAQLDQLSRLIESNGCKSP